MPDLGLLKCNVTYTYVEDKLIISFKRQPLFKVQKKDRKEAFAFVKENQNGILLSVAKEVMKRGLVC